MIACPLCGEKVTAHSSYTEKNTGNILVVCRCSTCSTDWVHAKATDKWYKYVPRAVDRKESAVVQAAAPEDKNRAQRLGRLIAIFDVANE